MVRWPPGQISKTMPGGPERRTVEVDGDRISYLAAGSGPVVLLLHGTFWSKVWEPVMGAIADAGWHGIAPDFPGFGRSGGELAEAAADARSLAHWTSRFLSALGIEAVHVVAGHDIGGAVAQHFAVARRNDLAGLVLMNSVLYDSWPVPAVERFRDPAVREATTQEDLLEAREASFAKAVSRDLGAEARGAWLEPWRDAVRARSWMAMAGRADARHTLEIADDVESLEAPILLVWGEDDEFQPIGYAERLAGAARRPQLVRVAGARHIPTVDAPEAVAEALGAFLRGPAVGSRPI